MLNPQAAKLLTMIAGAPPLDAVPVDSFRQRVEGAVPLSGEVRQLAAVDDVQIDEVPVRVYRPSRTTGLPVVAFAHAGAWAAGNLDTPDRLARDLAAESGAVVVAIDYRLAPEHPFPAGLSDCVAVVRRLLADGAGLAVDPARVAVCGESSGGNLLAATCQQLSGVGAGIVHQVLIYPPTDPAGVGDTESFHEFGGGGYFHSAGDIEFVSRVYAGDTDLSDPRISPLRARDLSGLPPATILTAEFDPLRDEAEAYGRKLIDAGVPTTQRRFRGQIHGFVSFAGVIDDAVVARSWIGERLRQTFS